MLHFDPKSNITILHLTSLDKHKKTRINTIQNNALGDAFFKEMKLTFLNTVSCLTRPWVNCVCVLCLTYQPFAIYHCQLRTSLYILIHFLNESLFYKIKLNFFYSISMRSIKQEFSRGQLSCAQFIFHFTKRKNSSIENPFLFNHDYTVTISRWTVLRHFRTF